MLFGHQNDDKPTDNSYIIGAADKPGEDASQAGADLPVPTNDLDQADASVLDQQVATDLPTNALDEQPTSAPIVSTSQVDDTLLTASPADDLLSLKQQALQQLSPLVGHLEQTPEEKFRTTMMMIQSTDNQSLIKDAYAAAQAITDDKIRAQALLDVINEINYFTQQSQN